MAEGAAAVLIVDRDASVGREIMGFLAERHYEVEWVDTGEKAYNRLDGRLFDVLVTELNVVHRVDGLRLMSVAKNRNPEVCVVFIADRPDIELATEAMREGAYDFQTKPVNLRKLEAVIQRGLEHQRLVLEQHHLRQRLDEQYGLGNLVGNSRQMVKVYNAVRKVAPTHSPVLIQGESGAGKDLIAQAIHSNSPRRDEAFVKVDCAALPGTEAEDILFGFVAKAVRADAGRPSSLLQPGRIERADRGTLYLDDIGELESGRQTQLAHVLREGRYRRAGDARVIPIDVRVIAASGRPLELKSFREDLYALLRPGLIELPPLRDRREDIPLLVQHFLRETSRASGVPVPEITRNGMDLLMRYDWPGNVRELRNIVEGMVVAGRGARPIGVNDIPPHIRKGAPSVVTEIHLPIGTSMNEVERLVIEETMKACGYSKEACAKILGIGLRTLYRKLRQYDVR